MDLLKKLEKQSVLHLKGFFEDIDWDAWRTQLQIQRPLQPDNASLKAQLFDLQHYACISQRATCDIARMTLAGQHVGSIRKTSPHLRVRPEASAHPSPSCALYCTTGGPTPSFDGVMRVVSKTGG